MVVRNLLNNSDSKLASSSSFWPGFVWLVESSTEGVISCTYDPLQAQEVSFPTSPLARHLELVCPLNQSKNCRYICAGPNPAKGRSRARLGNQLKSNFCETLGHKNTLPNVSNPCPKVGFWLTFANNSSHVFYLEENESLGVFYTPSLPATHSHLPAACSQQITLLTAARKLGHSINLVHICCNHQFTYFCTQLRLLVLFSLPPLLPPCFGHVVQLSYGQDMLI